MISQDYLQPFSISSFKPPKNLSSILLALFLVVIIYTEVHAQIRLPGQDQSDKLEAAGTILRFVDIALFKWGARIFAGICILAGGWSLKEQRFPVAVVCVIAALVIGTCPMWVENIFDIGGGNTLFAMITGNLPYLKIV